MEVPADIARRLKEVEDGLTLRWNPQAVLVKAGSFDSGGKARWAEYDGRFELWHVDAAGTEYMVFRLQDASGGFLPPGEWVVEHFRRHHPARFDGNIERMLAELVDKPNERKKESAAAAQKDLDDAIAEWWWHCGAPKSAAGLSYRGQRWRSPGANVGR